MKSVSLTDAVRGKRAIVIVFDDSEQGSQWMTFSVGDVPLESGDQDAIVSQLAEVRATILAQANPASINLERVGQRPEHLS